MIRLTSIMFTTDVDSKPFGYGNGADRLFFSDVAQRIKCPWWRRPNAQEIGTAIQDAVENLHQQMLWCQQSPERHILKRIEP